MYTCYHVLVNLSYFDIFGVKVLMVVAIREYSHCWVLKSFFNLIRACRGTKPHWTANPDEEKLFGELLGSVKKKSARLQVTGTLPIYRCSTAEKHEQSKLNNRRLIVACEIFQLSNMCLDNVVD